LKTSSGSGKQLRFRSHRPATGVVDAWSRTFRLRASDSLILGLGFSSGQSTDAFGYT